MASSLPPALRSPDISRFALRASQLEKFKPIIAYWCDYYVVQLILQKGLHTEGDDSMTYTTNLMDKLEKWKSENEENDAIHDDMAAQAYVEQFALETFQRAENAVKANKASVQTAETFRAAATFLDLQAIWKTPIDVEMAAKSKYAKYHALRIAKAVKAGEDPNLTNPTPEDPADAALTQPPALSPSDPEVQRINSLQPTVEDVSDNSRPVSFNELSATRGGQPAVTGQTIPTHTNTAGDVSPLEAEHPSDGYFPRTFTAGTASAVASLPPPPPPHPPPPTAPMDEKSSASASPSSLVSREPHDFYHVKSSSSTPQARQQSAYIPPHIPSQPPVAPIPQPMFSQRSAPPVPPPPPPPPAAIIHSTQVAHPGPEHYRRDDEAVMDAQKHAKWAISALNFEDVDTAVKELRIALHSLGAR